MKYAVFIFALCLSCIADTIPGDMLIHFETSSDGTAITKTILSNSFAGTLGGFFSSWDTIDGENQNSVVTPTQIISTTASQFNTPFFGNASGYYNGTSSRGYKIAGGTNGAIQAIFASNTARFSLGFFFRFNGARINFAPRDIVSLRDGLGGYQILQIYDDNPKFHTHWQSSSGFQGGIGNDINFVRDTWYWVTMNYARGGEVFRIRFYNLNGTLLGESSNTMTGTFTAGPRWFWLGGIKYNDTSDSSQSIMFDSLVINTNNVFPLGPGGGPLLIPSTNQVSWIPNQTVGVEGGIPNRTTIFATHNPGATFSQVQASLDACPSNQVVYLNTGTYNFSSGLNITRNGVTLRGAGQGQTIIISDVAGDAVTIQSGVITGGNTLIGLSSGYTKGSSNLVLSSTSAALHAGYHITVDQINDEVLVNNRGDDARPGERTDTTPEGDGRRAMNQTVEIKSLSGTAMTIWPPMYWTYSASLSPQLLFRPSSQSTYNYVLRTGIEDLTITNKNASGARIVFISRGANCWVKNVGTKKTGSGSNSTHIQMMRSYRCEIRHCTADGSFDTTTGNGYGYALEYQTCATLIEDNIIKNTRDFIKVDAGSSGNVVIYNYQTNVVANSDAPFFMPNTGGTHSAHPMMNLYEGNMSYKMTHDFTWGSSSHNTQFRNWYRGLMPYNSGANYPSQSGTAMNIEFTNRFQNIFGNILGFNGIASHGGFTTKSTLKIAPASMNYDNDYASMRIGYANSSDSGGGPSGTNQWNEFQVGNNYDYVNGSTNWYNPPRAEPLPSSYFYSSAPTNFGTLTWPPIDPASPTYSTSITNIPAGYRDVYGVDPGQSLSQRLVQRTAVRGRGRVRGGTFR
jgi:hypothetical protein